jgi:hypothetical protein
MPSVTTAVMALEPMMPIPGDVLINLIPDKLLALPKEVIE